MIPRADDGYYHPKTETEICELVKHAAAHGRKVRVRGSGHSVEAAIYTGAFKQPPRHDQDINLYLDRMAGVCFDYERQQVTVEAGCHLGKDPADPAGVSTVENSLFYQIDRKGWAFPDTGGISHQTVGGFMQTGSSGGSLHHSVGRQIVAIRAVDGLGNLREFRKSDDLNDPFYGMVVSMGLLGVITAVTFQCVDRFDIEGTETTSTVKHCKVDLFGPGSGDKPSLENFFKNAEHARLLWFPQKGVDKVLLWEARRWNKPAQAFTRKPYHEFPVILGSETPAQVAASLMFRLFDLLNPPPPTSLLGRGLKPLLKPLYPLVVNYFLASSLLKPQTFRDSWWQGLPMDDRVDYNLMPTQFTEMWFPLSQAAEVMQALQAHFSDGGFEATSTYVCEIYPTPSSNFWMSPSYQQEVIKIDPFWFALNRGNPDEVFYPKFWERLRQFNYRLHWGKALSGDVDYLKQQYPRWDDFMKLREQMDPQQVFVTDYWRNHLGIAPV